MLEGYQVFSNFDKYNGGSFHDSVDGVAYSFTTFAVSSGGLYLGQHIGRVLPRLPTQTAVRQRLAFTPPSSTV